MTLNERAQAILGELLMRVAQLQTELDMALDANAALAAKVQELTPPAKPAALAVHADDDGADAA